MTNSQVSELKKGDRVTDGAVVYEVTSDARISRSQTHFEAWATSPRGGIVVRVTANGDYARIPIVMNGGTRMSDKDRPDFVNEEHLEYLDDLRESGITNMYGAAPYVRDAFDIDLKTARDILQYWMNTFSARHPR